MNKSINLKSKFEIKRKFSENEEFWSHFDNKYLFFKATLTNKLIIVYFQKKSHQNCLHDNDNLRKNLQRFTNIG